MPPFPFLVLVGLFFLDARNIGGNPGGPTKGGNCAFAPIFALLLGFDRVFDAVDV
jgi:hypothetical protein